MDLSVQEKAARYVNTVGAKLNASVAKQAGYDVVWFRSIPKTESTDVVFMTYTLHNVDNCPKKMKMLYTDTTYDDAALTFSYNGIDYKPSITLEVPILIWNEAIEYDGTIPQKLDIAYIPMTNKLWQVATMTPVTAAGQLISYKMMMETYTPMASRAMSEEMMETIEESTVNVDKLFGAIIDETLEDLTDKKQLSQFSSTVKDEYKEISRKQDPDEVVPLRKVNKPISKNIEVDGHIFARSYYDMVGSKGTFVRYKNISDEVSVDDARCLSVWICPQHADNKAVNVEKISVAQKVRRNIALEITVDDASDIKIGDFVTITSDPIVFYAKVNSIDGNVLCVETRTEIINDIEKGVPDWTEFGDYTLTVDSPINLLFGETENGEFRIDIMSRKFVTVYHNERYTNVTLQRALDDNLWYGIVINLSTTLNVNVFNTRKCLDREFEKTVNMTWGDDLFTSYGVKASNTFMTNIRYYNIPNYNIDKQIEDLVSYNIKNNSKAIINDSADIYIDNTYYGEQR